MTGETAPLCYVVDASLMVRRVAARIIRDLGYEVEDAKTGSEALSLAGLRRPDVVLTDWNGPDMRADALIEGLRAVEGGSSIRVILCTAERDPERIRQALAAGADEYIIKPFDAEIVESKFRLAGLPVRLKPVRAVA